MAPNKIKLMLDSGVFSAWGQGKELSLKKYIKYLKENEKWLWSYVVMDVIPGKFGEARTRKQIMDSGERSYKNLQVMKDAGLRPIPVFHQGEEMSWLEKMLQDGEDYIGISSAKDKWPEDQRKWLDQIFTILTDRKTGLSLIKTHGFGITNPQLLFRYPWYSVDSTTWSLTPGYGMIIVPQYHNGKPNYLEPPVRVVVSGVDHKAAANQSMQFEAWAGDMHQDQVIKFLEEECGIDAMTTIRYGGRARRRTVLCYYLGLQKVIKDVRFRERAPNIMVTNRVKVPESLKPLSFPELHIMFATKIYKEWSQTMTAVGANTRLVSYFELMNRPNDELIEYVKTGLCGAWKEQEPANQNRNSETYLNYHRHRRRKALHKRLAKVRIAEGDVT